MDEDEAALLAELRAISSSSAAAAARFEQDETEHDAAAAARDQSNDMSFVSAKSSSSTDYFPDASPGSLTKTKTSVSASPVVLNDEKMDETQVIDDDVCKNEEPENIVPPSNTSMEETTPKESEAMSLKKNQEESSLSSTLLQGDRGGAAQDEPLLAELWEISANSSSARDDDIGNDAIAENSTDAESAQRSNKVPAPEKEICSESSAKLSSSGDSPTSTGDTANDRVDVVVAAPPKAVIEESAPQDAIREDCVPQPFGIKDSKKSTFTGDRGGAAEDAELLAELRAISAKSSSASRFADESNGNGAEESATEPKASETANETSSPPFAKESAPDSDTAEKLPPWKRGKKKAAKESSVDVDIVVAAPLSAPAPVEDQVFGVKDSKPSTFKGVRGGAAEDAELLAELRAISAKSSSASRFADEGNGNVDEAIVTEPIASEIANEESASPLVKEAEKSDSAQLPPWKRSKKKKAVKASLVEVDIVVAPPPQAPARDADISKNSAPQTFGIKDSKPSTFTGDRGGTAEDAELLAELRAISAKSSSASRFADESNDNGAEESAPEPKASETANEKSASPFAKESAPDSDTAEKLPPWKRGKKKAAKESSVDVDIVVAAPLSAPAPVEDQVFGVKDSKPSTFKGVRGGAAEDAELLAELRAISAKSSSSSRFADEGNGNVDEAIVTEPIASEIANEESASPLVKEAEKSDSAQLPPWKRSKKKKAVKASLVEVDIVVAAPPQAPARDADISENSAPQTFGIKDSKPSTSTGDRGGTAEDAELLAELRAISAKSSSASRFADESNGNEADASATKTEPKASETANEKSVSPLSKETKESDSAQLPPWKRGKKKAVTESSPMEVDIVVASPPAASNPIGEHTFGIKDSKPATFTGDCGGAAEDAELLAELRAISAKSSSASRFADESNHDVCEANKTEDVVAPTPKKNARENLSGTSKSKPVASELPPWKRGKSKGSKSSDNQVDIVVAAPPSSTPDQVSLQPQESNENQEQSFGIKSSLPSTFQGDRGGSAEDAELLAELRAISQKSFSADRFSDNIGAGGDHANTQTPISHADAISEKKAAAESKSRQDSSSASTSKAHSKSAADVPWKRANKKATKSSVPDVDVVIAASPAPPSRPELLQTDTSANEPLFETFGIKSALPSTFKGDRGGVAEDEELLAELRAISAKSTGTARFAEDSSAGDIVASELAMDASISDGSKPSRPRPSTKEPSSKVGEAQLPPWNRDKNKATGSPDVDVIVAAPERPAVVQQNAGIQSSLRSTFQGERGGPAEDAELLAELRAISSHSRGGIKSDLPSTFKGERGGSAEDADLLAELRAISSNSSSANRSKIDSAGHKGRSKENADQPVAEKPALATPRDAPVVPTMESQKTALPSNAASGDSDISVTRDSLPTAVTGKSWKLRKEAYDLLHSILSERIERGEGHGNIDGNSLLPGLDDLIVSMVSDGNAGALDSALVFAVDYAEHGSGVTSSELAAKIVASLIKGSALSSSRPSTSKSATALTLKLMEVGDGYASVHSVTEVLLSQGLSSRKPKIVIASSSLILEAAYGFGAGSLPLASISSSAPKMLSHTNATVRDTAMKIIAEICRALGSKSPLQSLIEGMKKAQVSQLDNLLDSQTEPTPIGIGLRSSKGSRSQSPADALAALETGAKELEAKRYAEREPVNIFQALSKTDYSTRIKLPKWSEKVAALDLVLECGGETPYKLVHPSPLANYSPIISEMKALLSHSHFAVASKAMQVLSMLAEGVGSGLFSHLRPLLHQLIMLSKDKKLNQAVGECLDVYFGNVLDIEHLLDTDDALPSVLNEKVQKNALVRASALHFLGRCVKRGESAGPRGRITGKSASSVARLCSDKLDDSDASVRKAATDTLRVLLSVEDEAILDAIMPIIETLQTKNSRAYKSLMKGSGIAQRIGGVSNIASGPPVRAADSGTRRTQTSPPIRKSFSQEVQKTSQQRTISQSVSKEMSAVGARSKQSSNKAAISTDKVRIEDSSDAPSLEDAISLVASMSVPSWDAPDDDGGVLAGLKSSKWLLRQNAILNLAAFSKEEESPVDGTEGPSAAVISVVKGHTKNFKETNVNVTKAIMELFIALSQIHVEQALPFPGWASRDAVSLAVEKIADKKLSALSSKLMSELCCVRPPQSILEHGIVCIDKVKSPLGHEAFLKWFQVFLCEFGALPISGALKGASPWLIKECESSNPKVRRVAVSVVGELHAQLGPIFRAVILSSCGDTASIKSQLERTFDESPFGQDAAKVERPRECVVLTSNISTGPGGGTTASAVLLDLPKMDLPASLPSDCIEKMGAKEGKNAWKLRKQALDDVEDALKKNNGLMIATDSPKPLVDLLRALRERLSDSQSNLKPVAARIIGSILGSVDSSSQAKLGRIVFTPLVGAVCNDNRKPMREASLEAIRLGTTASSVEGGEPNSSSLEPLMVAVVGELNESEFKAGGLPDMLTFVTGVADFLPNLDSVASARAQTLGDKFAAVMVGCLTSSKSETRSTAEALLKACIERDKLSLASVKKGMKKLLPAQQRTVIPIVARLPHKQPGSPNDGKENSVPSPPRGSRQPKPPGVSSTRPTVSSPRQRRHPDISRRIEATSKKPVPSSQADDSFDDEPFDPDDLHPLIANGEPGKKPLPSSRRINWPLHPEEPNSPVQINALKRMWSRSLPSRSATALFPSGGIKKQEDAMPGCALLCKAIEKDRAGKEEAIVDHIDLIFMWISFVLCSRESTVGLQSLLTLLIRLFAFLEDHRYKLSDNDAFILLPHIFEKASIAKGRFYEQFSNVISIFRSDIMSTRSLGQVICVPLIEHSHQSKTRVLAMHECRSCVDRIGLSGLGKKGLLVTAKTLSEENLPENRAAALELMETVLAKMDGDVEKLAGICGPNYLSDKGRAMIEEHWSKHGGNSQSMKPKSLQRDSKARRQSQIPSSRAASGINRSKRTISKSSQYLEANPSPNSPGAARTATEDMIRDELPSFKLELDETKSDGIDTRYTYSSVPSSGPFTFSFKNMRTFNESEILPSQEEEMGQEPVTSMTHQASTQPESSSVAMSSETGAAASLRARLLKIREKQKEEAAPSRSVISTSAPQPELSPTVLAESPLTESSSVRVPIKEAAKDKAEISHGASENSYDALRTCIEELLHTERPVPEAHPRLRDCTAALKKYHATISSQPTAAPEMSYTEFSDLRQNILDKTVEVIENLTSIVVFALDCEYPENTAGMSIPLLSVALATLMALFRDTDLSRNVTQDSLALLIREAGKALLDPRLAMASHHAMVSQLDESTSSQMVRAINKLAVQAATGSPRDVSIEALLALQLQLCTVGNETAADAAFNSRLSRIVTKLFAKVLKAELTTARPFSSETVDLEAIICALEDMLLATALAPGAPNRNRQDAVDTCSNMGRSLLIPLLNARGPVGIEEVRAMMDELGIDPRESKLALLVTSCESELDFSAATAGTATEADKEQVLSAAAATPPSPSRPPSMNIASLVSDLTSAPEGPQRDAAVAALRRYNDLHGKEELNEHLSEVSETFRAYIMEQLKEPGSPDKRSHNETSAANQSTSMSERIRFLRSKLNATEAVVQSAVEQHPIAESVKPTVDTQEFTIPSQRGIPEPSTPSRHGTTKESKLTPSRIPKPGTSSSSLSPSKATGTTQTLRERLAVAQKNRQAAAAAAAENEFDGGKSSGSTSAYGHAAALRARLEAVKQQTQSERNIK